VLLATSLIGGAHRVGLISTAGTVGTVDATPDPSVTTPTSSGDPSPTPSVTAPPQSTVAGLLPASECKLGPTGTDWYFSAGFPISNSSDVLTTGSLRVAVIYVEFPDAPRRSPVAELHKSIEEHVEKIYAEMSYGKLSLDLVSSGDWIMMEKSSTSYNVLQGEAEAEGVIRYVGEAVRKADPSIDFAGIDAVAVFATELADGIAGDFQLTLNERIATDEGSGAFSTIITGGDWWEEEVDPMILAHEFGHVIGLQDLYEGGSSDLFEVAHQHVGNFDFMSRGWSDAFAPTILGWNRWRLGWISDTQVICVRPAEGTEVVINALQSGSGPLLVVLPLSSTRAVVIESRRPIGWDRLLPESGALVYLVDTSIDTTEGPIKILADTFGDGFDSAPLSAGEYIDALSYTITSLEMGAWGDRIYITP
jgi:M6 family metalloprotease-like protein